MRAVPAQRQAWDWVDKPLWTERLSFARSGTYCRKCKCYVPNDGPVSETTLPSVFVFSPGKCPLPLSQPLPPFWLGKQQEQGDDQHQHCQHFEPSLSRKTVILPTSSLYPP